MVDISGKPEVYRVAKAEGEIRLKKGTLQAIERRQIRGRCLRSC